MGQRLNHIDLTSRGSQDEFFDPTGAGKRTPFNTAVSKDDGQTWEHKRTLDDDPHGWYCYTAIEFVDDRVLLGHCAGDRRTGGLATTRITMFNVDWLYS